MLEEAEDRLPRRAMLYCTESLMFANSLAIGLLAWSGRSPRALS